MPSSFCGNRSVLGLTIGDAMSIYPNISLFESDGGKMTYSYEKNDVIGFITYKNSDKLIYNQTIYITDITYDQARILFGVTRNEINSWGSFDSDRLIEKDHYYVNFDGYKNLVLKIISSDSKGKYHLVIDLTDTDIWSSINSYEPKPKNNLRIPLSELKKAFPDLKYNGPAGEYQVYIDGDVSEGVFSKFFLKNNRVLKEQLIVRSTNGFARDWFNSTSSSFTEKGGWVSYNMGVNENIYRYGNFKLVITYRSLSSYYETIVDYEAVIRDY